MWARSALRLTNARQRPPKIARTRLKVLYPRKLTSPVAKTWKNNGIRWNNRAQTHGIEGARVGFALLRCVGSEEAPHRLVADDDKADIWIDLAREPAHLRPRLRSLGRHWHGEHTGVTTAWVKADIRRCPRCVRFTADSGHHQLSGHNQRSFDSARPPPAW